MVLLCSDEGGVKESSRV